jgi:multiple sugar transport system ATP-binding protein
MALIELDAVSKVFAGGTVAVDDVSLRIRDGEFVVLVGPSGCGKTTLLRMIAGLEAATSGSIWIDGRDVTAAPPRERDIAMVFQNYALYPHMTVRDNLGYGLRIRRVPKRQLSERVQGAARMLGLSELLDRKPAALSGGQRQRVAMGRAIVREPAAFLMDEPLSNLDAKLRVGMRGSLAQLHQQLGRTTIYVTHDQTEAMTLGQRVVVMRDGLVQQVDTPQRLYEAPANLFVAAFIGSPSMNLTHATLAEDAVTFAGHRLPLGSPAARRRTPERVILGIRPEAFEDAEFADPALPQLEVPVVTVEQLGAETVVIFGVDVPRVRSDAVQAAEEEDDDDTLVPDSGSLFSARVDPRTRASSGTSLRLAVDPTRLYFFDPVSGESIGRSRDLELVQT